MVKSAKMTNMKTGRLKSSSVQGLYKKCISFILLACCVITGWYLLGTDKLVNHKRIKHVSKLARYSDAVELHMSGSSHNSPGRYEPSDLKTSRLTETGHSLSDSLKFQAPEAAGPIEHLGESVVGWTSWAGSLPTNFSKETLRWQKAADSGLYVFSAFYDPRVKGREVKVISAARQPVEKHMPLYCRLWFDAEHKYYNGTVIGKILKEDVRRGLLEYIFRIDRNSRIRSSIVYCNVSDIPRPIAVQLIANITPEYLQYFLAAKANMSQMVYKDFMPPVLKVLDRSKGWPDQQQDIGLCIHGALINYNDTSWFIQALELYKMFGAQQVFIYHRSSNLSSVLDFYVKQGFVTVIPWNVTAIEEGLGRQMPYNYKQLAVQNDCVLRNIHRFKYLLMHDIDEVIVPYLHENYSAMMQSFPSRAAYRFSNAFFPRVFIDNVTVYENRTGDKDGRMLRYKPVALLATKRLHVWFGGGRWKMIIRPEKVNLMTTHSAINTTSVYAVLPSEAILHHFRQGSPIYVRKNKVLKKNFLETRMYHFKEKYLARLETAEKMMKKVEITWP